MIISELIAILGAHRSKQGDLPVYVHTVQGDQDWDYDYEFSREDISICQSDKKEDLPKRISIKVT